MKTGLISKFRKLIGVLEDGINTKYNSYLFHKHGVVTENWKVNGRLILNNSGTIVIGSGLLINSGLKYNLINEGFKSKIIVRDGGKLIIGKNFGMSNSTIICSLNIRIGNNVMFGGNCKIWDTDFHSIEFKDRCVGNDNNVIRKPIFIEDNVFIGANSIVLKGVNIGFGSFIGAGSVVSKSIPNNEMWAGNPIRFIKSINTPL